MKRNRLTNECTGRIYSPFDAHESEQINRQALLAAPEVFQTMLLQLKEELKELDALAPLHVTEFGVAFLPGMITWKYNVDLVAGVYLGDMFLTYAQNDIWNAYYWSLISNWCFGAYGATPRTTTKLSANHGGTCRTLTDR